MSIRDADIDNLIVKLSAYFSNKVIKGVANPVDATDAVNLQTLNAAVISGGWDSVTFNTSTGDLKFFISAVLDFTVNLDDRYTTTAEVVALIDSASQAVFTIEMPIESNLIDSAAGATVPAGWSLAVSGPNLIVIHDTGRSGADVTVSYNISGDEYKFLRPFADAYQGYSNLNSNQFRIETISTRYTVSILRIYVTLENPFTAP